MVLSNQIFEKPFLSLFLPPPLNANNIEKDRFIVVWRVFLKLLVFLQNHHFAQMKLFFQFFAFLVHHITNLDPILQLFLKLGKVYRTVRGMYLIYIWLRSLSCLSLFCISPLHTVERYKSLECRQSSFTAFLWGVNSVPWRFSACLHLNFLRCSAWFMWTPILVILLLQPRVPFMLWRTHYFRK